MVSPSRLFKIFLFASFLLAFLPPESIWADNSILLDEKATGQLLSARTDAEILISKGDLSGATWLLVQSLRDMPPSQPYLADVAYGNIQLIHFVLAYLIQEDTAAELLFKQLEPDKYASDNFLQNGFQLIMTPDKREQTRLTRALLRLTESDNEVIAVICQFTLSNPYLNYEDDFTRQFSQLLAKKYPNLELAQFSLNFPLFKMSKEGDMLDLSKVIDLEPINKTIDHKAGWSEGLRRNIKESAKLLQASDGKSKEATLSPMYASMVNASDWRERHFAMLLMRDEIEKETGSWMRDGAREVAARNSSSPDVIFAKYLLAQTLSADCMESAENKQALREESVKLARELLETSVTDISPERVMWHVRMSGIRGCAQNLAKAGYAGDAVELFSALGSQYPNSKIEAECGMAIANITSAEVSLVDATNN